MFIHELKIIINDLEQQDNIVDEFYSLLSLLYKNGQIIDRNHTVVRRSDREIIAYVLTYELEYLSLSYSNKYVKEQLELLKKLGGESLSTNLIGENPVDANCCKCLNMQSFILFTHYLSIDSPLNCGECFCPVPLYKIPHLYDEEYLDILSWQANYKSCDNLQMNSEVGEKFSTKQMSKINSELSKQGINLCKQITKKTNVPVYYYLYKGYCRKPKKEQKRKCPCCKKKWLQDKAWHKIFDFKCDKCLLLSNIAWGIR